MTLPYRNPSPIELGDPSYAAPPAPIVGELFMAMLFTVLGVGLWWLVGRILHSDVLAAVRALA